MDAKRSITASAITVAIAAFAAGCGGDDDGDAGLQTEPGVQELAITIAGPSQIEAPDSAEAGLAEITVENTGSEVADAQLTRVEGERSAEEVVEGHNAIAAGEPAPEWLLPDGGVAAVAGGSQATATQVLGPGTYYVIDTADPTPDAESLQRIEVSGEPSDEALPQGDAAVRGFDYGFETRGLKPGPNQILFENSGQQPHHLVAAPIDEGKTIADVRRFFEDGQGPEPVDFAREQRSAVLGPGESQLVRFDLEPRRWALLCFVFNFEGGAPHVEQGMVEEVRVGR